jgi:uncharacterized repeat protein (TIGR04076 family)
MGRKVKITVTYSNCRSGFHAAGDEYIIDEDNTKCPPMCMELWNYAFPYVWNLLNGGTSDSAEGIRKTSNKIICPDQGRVHLDIELIDNKGE